MWPYMGKARMLLKCPADLSAVNTPQGRLPRVRSNSMSQVFAYGEWLDGGPNRGQTRWRTYTKGSTIVVPVKTFVFVEEHPDSINDSAFASQCTGNQGSDPPGAARIIDIPASFHNGACAFTFADGHAEIHKWVGRTIQPPVQYNGTIPLNISAGDSWIDAHWIADNTTVRN